MSERTHGLSKTREFQIWQQMLARCENPRSPYYRNYGGRGIKVSQAWHDFANFMRDMGPRPAGDYSIERLDVNGHYEVTNCKWATRHEQARNKRNNQVFELNGTRMCLADWARHLGTAESTLYYRLFTAGWTVERALTTPGRREKAHV